MALGSLITAASGLCATLLTKCKCSYRRSEEDGCQPACGFQDKPLRDERHELEIYQHVLDNVPLLLIPLN